MIRFISFHTAKGTNNAYMYFRWRGSIVWSVYLLYSISFNTFNKNKTHTSKHECYTMRT